MKQIIVLLVLLAVPSAGYSITVHVPANQPSIQAAIETAASGDKIVVEPGIYHELIDFMGKAITLVSEEGPEVTIIDGNQLGPIVICTKGEEADSVLDGFTITNGRAYYGGGMVNISSSPRVINCIFTNNSSDAGGGAIYNLESMPILSHCTFSENSAVWGGGGIWNWGASPLVSDCLFTGNSAQQTGGGIYNKSSSPTLQGCIFIGNSGETGGGMYNWMSSPIVQSSIFIGNSADHSGGGMYNMSELIYLPSSPKVMNCTFYGNMALLEGGGICNMSYSDSIVTNTILWNNQAQTGSEICIGDFLLGKPSALTISYSDVRSGPSSVYVETGCMLDWGAGMIDADPLFVDPVHNDVHLYFNSPCRGSGQNSALGLYLYDFEGDPRVCQGTVDMGADEFHTHLYYTGDAMPGGEIVGKLIGLPGTYPAGLWFGLAGVLDPPIQTKYGQWHLNHPWIPVWLVEPIPPSGVLKFPAKLPYYPAPYDLPVQGLVGLNSDSLTNLCVLKVAPGET